MKKSLSILFAFALAVCSAEVRNAPCHDSPATKPGAGSVNAPVAWRNFPEVSPFQAVRWRKSTPEVRVSGLWFQLVSIDDLTANKIVHTCQSLDKKDWQKRFEEDLIAVLSQMGWKNKKDVTLNLRHLDTGQTETIEHVGLTGENRRAIWKASHEHEEKPAPDAPSAHNAKQPTPNNPGKLWQNFPRLSAFEAVRWRGEVPEVRIGGAWYELLKFNDVPVSQIIAKCKSLDDDDWQKRFEEDLVEILSRIGHQPGTTASLHVKDLQTGGTSILKDVAMTEFNRTALFRARFDREQNQQHALLTRQQAEEDIDSLQSALANQYSYLTRRGINYEEAFSRLRAGLSETNRQEQMKVELMKALALFGDGHSGVAQLDDAFQSGFLPFLIGDTTKGLVAFREDRSGFVEADFPMLKSLDGLPAERWLDKAHLIVPAGSPQFVRRSSIRFLRFVDYLRGELALPVTDTLRVEFESESGARTKIVDIPLASKKPIYGIWPKTVHHLLPSENIGYLRLDSMSDDEGFLKGLVAAMHEFRATRGLIIDVRGNGGGLRDGLRVLFPFFMRPDDAPRVVNVAAYRLNSNDTRQAPEGYLADRNLYPITSRVWSPRERVMLQHFAREFKPEWAPPKDKFSHWHYSVIGPVKDERTYYYDRPVVILMDSECFSATDIFLGAFKGWRNVTLMGSASGGGSGRPREIKLPHGSIQVKLSTMASFQANGQLYDGQGIAPDVEVLASPSDLLGQTDMVLEAAVKRLR